ncbi:rac GTPase-activating protein 1 isoform X1 [Parasteatoda tepidariorum]|uniref:rac GTPase-activating protein 1 isoform X1 n=2 Tax=Parasteatoda tepidariorum TaxID=114398 RepID=UPI00077F97BE|nr:rac GTPase-activating protein 1 isoform X2 [Parasteatoda tepidariorum]
MLPNNMPQLSLVAQYDDLCRHTKSLTEGCEKEFKQYVETKKRLHRRRKEAEAELEMLRKRVAELERGKQKFETRLKHMKSTILAEIEKRKKLEQEKSSMETIITLIKEVLLSNGNTIDNQTKEKLFQLSSNYRNQGGSPSRLTTIEESVGSLLSDSECDESEDDIHIAVTQRKRRSKGKSSNINEHSLKKRKSEEKANSPCFDDDFCLESDYVAKKSTVKFCSNSELTSDSSDAPPSRPVLRSESAHSSVRNYDLKRNDYIGSTPTGRYSLGGRANKPHAFAVKTVIRTEKCYPCGKVIKFCKQVLKCGNCRMTCHPECKDQCPERCIPANFTPTKGVPGTLCDYTPSTPPMIPPLIIHCVSKVESSGLKELGLYRVSGSEREVKELKEKFLNGRSIPSLNGVDIHAVCGTIKEFLRSLKDTLITKAAWQIFVDAANRHDEEQSFNMLLNAFSDLPQPNRDTLAFLILHWQKVAASRECKMNIDNLARVVAPTVVGFSETEPANMLTETRLICRVMERLLMIPSDTWQNMLTVETEQFHTPMKTPECTPAPVTSRLGPILTSGQKMKSTTVVKTPYRSRTPRTDSKVGRRQFFSSPLIKN